MDVSTNIVIEVGGCGGQVLERCSACSVCGREMGWRGLV
jgi:hypothetical protein